MRGPIRNHGVAVLQQPNGHKAFRELRDTLSRTLSWDRDLFLVQPKSIEHFIFIGRFLFDWVNDMHGKKYFICETLNKVTFCEDVFCCEDELDVCTKTPASLSDVHFVNCQFYLSDYIIELSAVDEFVAAAAAVAARPYHYTQRGIERNFKVLIPHLKRNRSHDSSLFGKQETTCCSTLLEKKLDENNLIWPYPEEQVQWLLKSLEGLEGTVLQSVKDTDKQWVGHL